MRAVNHFIGWLRKEGEVGAIRAQTPRLPKRLVNVLSRDEIRSLEDAAHSRRDKMIVRLLADTGIRLGELVTLRTVDVVSRGRDGVQLHIRGKGEKDRLVPIPGLYKRLDDYVKNDRPKDTHSDRLFLTARRSTLGYEPLTTSGAHQVVRNAARIAGLGKRVYPHLLRHSYATWALSRGMNVIQLKDILGHSSLAMISSVYSHLSPSDAYEAMVKVLLAEDGKA